MDEYTFPGRSIRPQAQGNASASSSAAGPTPDSQASAPAPAQDVAAASAQPAPPPASFLSAHPPLRRASMGDMGTPHAPSSHPSSMPHGDFPSYYTSEVTAPPHVARPQPLPDPERPTTSWWARPSHRLLPEVQTPQHLSVPQGSAHSAYWVPASSQPGGQLDQSQHQGMPVEASLPQHPALVSPQAPALAPLSESSVGPVDPRQLLEPTEGSTHLSTSRTPVWGSLGPSPDPRPTCYACRTSGAHCSGTQPCAACLARGLLCIYTASPTQVTSLGPTSAQLRSTRQPGGSHEAESAGSGGGGPASWPESEMGSLTISGASTTRRKRRFAAEGGPGEGSQLELEVERRSVPRTRTSTPHVTHHAANTPSSIRGGADAYPSAISSHAEASSAYLHHPSQSSHPLAQAMRRQSVPTLPMPPAPVLRHTLPTHFELAPGQTRYQLPARSHSVPAQSTLPGTTASSEAAHVMTQQWHAEPAPISAALNLQPIPSFTFPLPQPHPVQPGIFLPATQMSPTTTETMPSTTPGMQFDYLAVPSAHLVAPASQAAPPSEHLTAPHRSMSLAPSPAPPAQVSRSASWPYLTGHPQADFWMGPVGLAPSAVEGGGTMGNALAVGSRGDGGGANDAEGGDSVVGGAVDGGGTDAGGGPESSAGVDAMRRPTERDGW